MGQKASKAAPAAQTPSPAAVETTAGSPALPVSSVPPPGTTAPDSPLDHTGLETDKHSHGTINPPAAVKDEAEEVPASSSAAVHDNPIFEAHEPSVEKGASALAGPSVSAPQVPEPAVAEHLAADGPVKHGVTEPTLRESEATKPKDIEAEPRIPAAPATEHTAAAKAVPDTFGNASEIKSDTGIGAAELAKPSNRPASNHISAPQDGKVQKRGCFNCFSPGPKKTKKSKSSKTAAATAAVPIGQPTAAAVVPHQEPQAVPVPSAVDSEVPPIPEEKFVEEPAPKGTSNFASEHPPTVQEPTTAVATPMPAAALVGGVQHSTGQGDKSIGEITPEENKSALPVKEPQVNTIPEHHAPLTKDVKQPHAEASGDSLRALPVPRADELAQLPLKHETATVTPPHAAGSPVQPATSAAAIAPATPPIVTEHEPVEKTAAAVPLPPPAAASHETPSIKEVHEKPATDIVSSEKSPVAAAPASELPPIATPERSAESLKPISLPESSTAATPVAVGSTPRRELGGLSDTQRSGEMTPLSKLQLEHETLDGTVGVPDGKGYIGSTTAHLPNKSSVDFEEPRETANIGEAARQATLSENVPSSGYDEVTPEIAEVGDAPVVDETTADAATGDALAAGAAAGALTASASKKAIASQKRAAKEAEKQRARETKALEKRKSSQLKEKKKLEKAASKKAMAAAGGGSGWFSWLWGSAAAAPKTAGAAAGTGAQSAVAGTEGVTAGTEGAQPAAGVLEGAAVGGAAGGLAGGAVVATAGPSRAAEPGVELESETPITPAPSEAAAEPVTPTSSLTTKKSIKRTKSAKVDYSAIHFAKTPSKVLRGGYNPSTGLYDTGASRVPPGAYSPMRSNSTKLQDSVDVAKQATLQHKASIDRTPITDRALASQSSKRLPQSEKPKMGRGINRPEVSSNMRPLTTSLG